MFRFFLKQKIEDPQNIVIADKEIIHKLTKVLRKKVGDTFFIFDSQAEEYEVEIIEINSKQVACKSLSRSFVDRELSVAINLYQALLKKDKFELVLQKAAEIGVKTINPLLTEFCVAEKLSENKISRCHKIIEEATLQSGGKIPPDFIALADFKEAIQSLPAQDLSLIAYENEDKNSLKEIIDKTQARTINIFIGPEGGFSSEEINLALRNSVAPVSLGKRILRAETAAVVACGIIAQKN